MNMTTEELLRHYRLAKDPQADIQILAELNAVSKTHMRKLLQEAGAELPDGRKKRKKKEAVEGAANTRMAGGADGSDSRRRKETEGMEEVMEEARADNTRMAGGAGTLPAAVTHGALAQVFRNIEGILVMAGDEPSPMTGAAAMNLCLSMMRDLLDPWAGSGRKEAGPYDEKA